MEAEEINQVQIPIDVETENTEVPLLAMLTSLGEEMSKLCALTPKQCIYRVPKRLRDKNPAAYTPKVVSIGPIHYRGKGLGGAIKEYKQRYLEVILCRVHYNLEEFAEFVKVREPRLRECYADTIHLTSSEFVKMMMVDSAFVYGMLVRAFCGKTGSCRMFDKPFLYKSVIDDLMLLENQIPLFILEELFNLEKKARSTDNEDRSTRQSTSQITEPAGEDSFMGLVRKLLNSRGDVGVSSYDIDQVSSSTVVHLLDYLRICHLSQSPPHKSGESSSVRDTVPTITELHQSGVTFEKAESTPLLHIKFDCQQGTLKIPQFFMGDSTETIFRNLLAFEQCHYEDDQRLADYFALLDELISQPSDVDLLVKSKVLKNTLGDSTRAANLVNDMARGLMMRPESHFDVLRRDLADYYKVPWHNWKATLRQDYFNNPWAGISVIAAVILLVLTVIQTVYAVI